VSNLSGKTAVVIGGETGIGRAISTAIARSGASVHVAGILEDEGAKTVDAIRSSGGQAAFSQLDVRETDKIARVVTGAHSTGLDILVYCAGIFDNMVGCLDTTEKFWDGDGYQS
jgi:2-keto-3-deoxy-L-fuconate dehydrogenase